MHRLMGSMPVGGLAPAFRWTPRAGSSQMTPRSWTFSSQASSLWWTPARCPRSSSNYGTGRLSSNSHAPPPNSARLGSGSVGRALSLRRPVRRSPWRSAPGAVPSSAPSPRQFSDSGVARPRALASHTVVVATGAGRGRGGCRRSILTASDSGSPGRANIGACVGRTSRPRSSPTPAATEFALPRSTVETLITQFSLFSAAK